LSLSLPFVPPTFFCLGMGICCHDHFLNMPPPTIFHIGRLQFTWFRFNVLLRRWRHLKFRPLPRIFFFFSLARWPSFFPILVDDNTAGRFLSLENRHFFSWFFGYPGPCSSPTQAYFVLGPPRFSSFFCCMFSHNIFPSSFSPFSLFSTLFLNFCLEPNQGPLLNSTTGKPPPPGVFPFFFPVFSSYCQD